MLNSVVLPAPFGENAEDLALVDLEIQPVDDDEAAEGARKRGEFKHRVGLSRAKRCNSACYQA
jgi:hypothetical protein